MRRGADISLSVTEECETAPNYAQERAWELLFDLLLSPQSESADVDSQAMQTTLRSRTANALGLSPTEKIMHPQKV